MEPVAEISAETTDLIRSHRLETVIEDFTRDGYAVMRDVAPIDTTERIRQAIVERAHAGGPASMSATAELLLGTDPVFEEAVLNPKVLAIVEAICGKGAMLSQLLGSVRQSGPDHVPLHADQSWLPSPFPEHTQLLTLCWTCDDYSREGGATAVVPGSHRLRRNPTPAEVADPRDLIPIECERGAVVGWLGETWHSSYPREVAGDRVVLHMTFSRLALRPVENYDHLDDEWLEVRPDALSTLLGRRDFLNKPDLDRHGPEYLKLVRQTQAWGKENTFRVRFRAGDS